MSKATKLSGQIPPAFFRFRQWKCVRIAGEDLFETVAASIVAC
jgi:hypothetical protein